jgi:hypothetical protein
MTEVYGYLLNEEERLYSNCDPNTPAKIFMHTDEKYVYNEKARKIAMLLILSDSVKSADFEIDEKQLFGELGRIAYKHDETKINDMKAFGKKVLLEQAIVAIVSNWESYFSGIFRKMFDDDEFIKRILDQKETFEKFLNEFRLFSDFQKIVILVDINIVRLPTDRTEIDKHAWTEITKLFEARHILVHSSTDVIENNQKFKREVEQGIKRISDVYTKIEIEKVMKDMAKMTDTIDMKLFDRYDTKYVEINEE